MYYHAHSFADWRGDSVPSAFHSLEPEWCGRSIRGVSRKVCCLFRCSRHFCPYFTGQSKPHGPKANFLVEKPAELLGEGCRDGEVWSMGHIPLPQLSNLIHYLWKVVVVLQGYCVSLQKTNVSVTGNGLLKVMPNQWSDHRVIILDQVWEKGGMQQSSPLGKAEHVVPWVTCHRWLLLMEYIQWKGCWGCFHHIDMCHYQEQAIPSLSLLMCAGVFIPQEWTEFCFTSSNDWIFSFHFSRSLSPDDNKNRIMRQFLRMVTMPGLFVVPSY